MAKQAAIDKLLPNQTFFLSQLRDMQLRQGYQLDLTWGQTLIEQILFGI